MKVSYVTTALLFSLYCMMPQAISSEIIPAKIFDNENPSIRDEFTSRGGTEGWAHVSFIIDVDGNTQDVVVFDYSGKERYIKYTNRYVNNLHYTPASIDGTPVVSSKNIFLQHTFAGPGYSEASVTPAFAREYQQVIDGLAQPSPDLAKAKLLIVTLKADYAKNLNEHALTAWLESIYYYKQQNFLQYLRQSRITLELHKYLPLAILSKSTVNLFEAQIHFGYYAEAKQTLDRMAKIEGLNLSEEVEEQFLLQVDKNINSEEPIQVTGQLSSLGGWVYHNQTREFKINDIIGKIDSVELRCLGFHKTFVSHTQTFRLPAEANNCLTLVQGEQGTTFTLLNTDTVVIGLI